MTEETIFAEGLRIEKPTVKTPSFVKGKLGINVESFVKFLMANKNSQGWVNIDILESKEKGTWYGKLNTWKRSQKPEGDNLQDGGSDPF